MTDHDREELIDAVEDILNDPIASVLDNRVVARRIVAEVEAKMTPTGGMSS